MVTLYDAVALSGARKTADGFLVADVRVARTGIQEYLGSEVDPDGSLGLRGKQIVRVYRPEEEVFSEKSMHTYAHRTITNDHPSEMVDSSNWKKLTVGHTGEPVVKDGEWVRVPMLLMDAATIAQVEGGKRQLSMGYRCTLDATPGTTPDGVGYDAVQRGLRMNHLAVVAAARAGPGASVPVGDGNASVEAGMEDGRMTANLQKVVVDGLTIETTDQGAQVIAKLQRQVADSTEKEKEKEKEIAKKDAELATKDAKIASLEKAQLDGAALDAAVAARADLLDRAKRIAPKVETRGLSDAAIKKAVVVARVGDSMRDKSEAYIDARFDMLAEDAETTDDAGRQLRDGLRMSAPTGDAAQQYADAVAKSTADLNAHRSK